MKHIQQKYISDCGPTCIAMIAGISHAKALKLTLPWHKKRKDYGTYFWQLEKAIKKLGLKFKIKSKKSFSSIKNNAIVSIYNEKDNYSHVVVWNAEEKQIYDPALSYAQIYISMYELCYLEKNMDWILEIIE